MVRASNEALASVDSSTLRNQCTYQKCKNNDINDYCLKYSINDDKFIENLKIDNLFCKGHLDSYIRIMYELNSVFDENDINSFIQCNGCKMYLPNDIFEGCLTCKICKSFYEALASVDDQPRVEIGLKLKKLQKNVY